MRLFSRRFSLLGLGFCRHMMAHCATGHGPENGMMLKMSCNSANDSPFNATGRMSQ
jgi:hypothetical protein